MYVYIYIYICILIYIYIFMHTNIHAYVFVQWFVFQLTMVTQKHLKKKWDLEDEFGLVNPGDMMRFDGRLNTPSIGSRVLRVWKFSGGVNHVSRLWVGWTLPMSTGVNHVCRLWVGWLCQCPRSIFTKDFVGASQKPCAELWALSLQVFQSYSLLTS